ncbi:hypothetical protein AB00_1899 [Raoultella ornithinolytica 2-156-04_S1_C1]|nr:hypothetical protein AB00_1899 [Raoultella ornithinolytica 2-156-04_S1_C1]
MLVKEDQRDATMKMAGRKQGNTPAAAGVGIQKERVTPA